MYTRTIEVAHHLSEVTKDIVIGDQCEHMTDFLRPQRLNTWQALTGRSSAEESYTIWEGYGGSRDHSCIPVLLGIRPHDVLCQA